MAKQGGTMQVSGDIGNVSFFERKGKFFARKKATVKPGRFKTDPGFERVRENASEFTRAANASKLLRDAMRNITANSSDSQSYTRLLGLMMRALKADPVNDRGQRNVNDGELGFVKGYDFNIAAELTAIFKAQFAPTIDRAAGTLTVSVQAFVPALMVIPPVGATHVRLIAAGAELDFAGDEYVSNVTASKELKLGNDTVQALTLEVLVTPGSVRPLFLALGIEFVQEVNEKFYTLKNGVFNSISIISVNTPE